MNMYERLINEILMMEGLRSAKKRFNAIVCDEFIEKIAEICDPSKTKKYTEWIVHQFIKSVEKNKVDGSYSFSKWIAFDNIYEISKKFSEEFDQWKKWGIFDWSIDWLPKYDLCVNRKLITGKDADIYSYDMESQSDMARFNKILRNAINKINQRNLEKVPHAQRFQYEDSQIFFVKTREQACKYGYRTTWCTSSINAPNPFNDYNSKFYVFFVVNNNKKYMVMVSKNKRFLAIEDDDLPFYTDSVEVWNQKNERLDMKDMKSFFDNIIPFKFFKDIIKKEIDN